jgi:hypothetical protein
MSGLPLSLFIFARPRAFEPLVSLLTTHTIK